MAVSLSELFPDEDYRFHLTLRKGSLQEFLAERRPEVLRERREWLSGNTGRYIAAEANAAPLVAELVRTVAPGGDATPSAGTADQLVHLGSKLEPDLVLLARDAAGTFRVRAGVVCFPSSWSLPEKLGLTLDETHAVVPGLNASMAPRISQFLDRLRPEAAYMRANWGLAATPELNMHPELRRPGLQPPLDAHRVWVRCEEQLLMLLPATGAITFGIRISVHPLSAVLQDSTLRRGFRRALQTMPEPLARYKGIADLRGELIERAAG